MPSILSSLILAKHATPYRINVQTELLLLRHKSCHFNCINYVQGMDLSMNEVKLLQSDTTLTPYDAGSFGWVALGNLVMLWRVAK